MRVKSILDTSAGTETRYTAWGEIRYASGTSPTDYTYTGQFSYTADFGLMFYNARWYDSSLGRFAQADSIIPGGAQGLDRYAYTNNNPLRYIDPSGHVECEPGTDCRPPGSSYNGPCGLNSICNASRNLYVIAGINYHKTGIGSWSLFGRKFNSLSQRGKYDSIGPAQVSDIEMETPYGKELTYPGTNKVRKTGLGLRSGSCDSGCSMDQDNPGVANLAMRTRLTLRLDVCAEHKCTPTDMFVVSALSIDEQIAPSVVEKAFNGKFNSKDPNITVVNWNKFITSQMGTEQFHLIHKIQDQVNTLLNNGYDNPGVDWNYITGLK